MGFGFIPWWCVGGCSAGCGVRDASSSVQVKDNAAAGDTSWFRCTSHIQRPQELWDTDRSWSAAPHTYTATLPNTHTHTHTHTHTEEIWLTDWVTAAKQELKKRTNNGGNLIYFFVVPLDIITTLKMKRWLWDFKFSFILSFTLSLLVQSFSMIEK